MEEKIILGIKEKKTKNTERERVTLFEKKAHKTRKHVDRTMRGPHSVVTTTFIPLTMVRLLSFRKILVAWRMMGEKLKRQTVERKKKKQQRQQKRRPNRAKCFPPVLERVDAVFGETTRSRADLSASKIQTRWKAAREERRVRDELYHVWRSVSAARTIQEHWKSKREERYARLAREKEEGRRIRMAVSRIQAAWRDFKDVQDTMASLLLAAEMLAAEEERRVSRLRREAARTISEAYFRHRWVQI